MGWICALPVELAAATEMLDEEHQSLLQDPNDNNIYTFGCIKQHNVVIACLPAAQIGNNPSATVTTQMKSKFPSIQFGLMVGVGGGVPSADEDVRLGDVVVSQPLMQFGGVVQYDSGKIGIDQNFMRTGMLNLPPPILFLAVAKLRANEMRGKVKLSEHLLKVSRITKFTYQGTEHGNLYKASYDHVGGTTCEKCRKDQLLYRKPRESTEIVIHYGTTASGNQVIKNGIMRDRLSSALGGILCFEIEAAGLMTTFPCLVVRGICDYADSHRNKKIWQP